MGRIDVVKIGSKRELHDFIRVPYHIYEHCPQYVPDLESSICELFDPQKNPAFEFSHIQPFVAYCLGDDQSAKTPVGRIVGIINRKANER